MSSLSLPSLQLVLADSLLCGLALLLARKLCCRKELSALMGP